MYRILPRGRCWIGRLSTKRSRSRLASPSIQLQQLPRRVSSPDLAAQETKRRKGPTRIVGPESQDKGPELTTA
jgi:hypothetical protein